MVLTPLKPNFFPLLKMCQTFLKEKVRNVHQQVLMCELFSLFLSLFLDLYLRFLGKGFCFFSLRMDREVSMIFVL